MIPLTAAPKEIACDGKHPYESLDLARSVARRKTRDSYLEVYKCAYCDKWHLGQPLRNRRGKQNRMKHARR